jgi:signal transduction histidine kinase
MKTTNPNGPGSAPAEQGGNDPGQGLPEDIRRQLAHDLRTPLSAMAGWLHLIETGNLDAAGLKRAVAKLQSNIDDQVRTIEKYLGNREERH